VQVKDQNDDTHGRLSKTKPTKKKNKKQTNEKKKNKKKKTKQTSKTRELFRESGE